jgi:hypothetical protein
MMFFVPPLEDRVECSLYLAPGSRKMTFADLHNEFLSPI